MTETATTVDFSDMDDLDTAEVSDTKAPTMLEAGAAFAQRVEDGEVQAPRARKPGRRDVPRDAVKYGPCPKCRGTGIYTGYGFRGSRCFPCNGTGNGLSIDPKAVRARERAAEREANVIRGRIADAAAFRAANPDITAWWAANPNFGFATSTSASLDKFGSLTPNQVDAIRKCIAGQAERDAARAAERAARVVSIAGEGFTKLLEHFTKAKASGLKNPAMVFDGVCFKLAKKYPGSLYVTETKTFGSEYYGRVDGNGKLDPTRAVTPEKLAQIVAIGADPIGQAVAYGKRTGTCCCCGAELTNAISIEYGIGPVCRERWGM